MGGNVRKGMRRRAGRGLGKYSRTEWGSRITHTGRINQVAHKQQTNKQRGLGRVQGEGFCNSVGLLRSRESRG